MLSVPWSVKYLFVPNSPISPENRGKEDGENQRMQSVF